MKRPTVMNVNPPGGWSFSFPSGHVITAQHPNVLLEKAFKYLEVNGLDTSTGWSDRFWDDLCRQNERLECFDKDVPAPEFTKDDLRQFGVTVGRWIDGGGQWVSPELAESRAKICIGCPHHGHVGGCSGCKGVLEWLSGLVGNRPGVMDTQLMSCKKCKCFLSIKTKLPIEVMSDSPPAEDFPSFCWIRKEKEVAK